MKIIFFPSHPAITPVTGAEAKNQNRRKIFVVFVRYHDAVQFSSQWPVSPRLCPTSNLDRLDHRNPKVWIR